jgi:hypothetical protein
MRLVWMRPPGAIRLVPTLTTRRILSTNLAVLARVVRKFAC